MARVRAAIPGAPGRAAPPMTPEVDRGLMMLLTLGIVGASTVGFLAAFRIAEALAGWAGRALAAARRLVAPRCPDCLGFGWRRWSPGDGAPFKGWTDCRLCRGEGRILDRGAP